MRWRSGNPRWSHTRTATARCCCYSSLANPTSPRPPHHPGRAARRRARARNIRPRHASWPHGAPSAWGRDHRAAEEMRNFLDRRAAMGSVYMHPYFLMLLADAWLWLGRPRLEPRSRRVWPKLRRLASTFARPSCTGCAPASAWLSTPVTLGAPRPPSTPGSPPRVTNRRASSSFEPPAIRPAAGRSGRAAESPRPARAGLRLVVHRRLQNRRSEGCEGAPGSLRKNRCLPPRRRSTATRS